MTKFVGLRSETYSYLTDDSSEDKKAKGTKKCVKKTKLKFGNYKNRFEWTQLNNKINYLEKKIMYIVLEKIRNNRLILKTRQTFKSERHNDFTEKINEIALSPNDDKRM